jgi:hypothetical protein
MMSQQQVEYNKKGDEAMKRLDYDDARLFYGEGMPNCDMYSINQLTTIWMANEAMRTSMYNLMNRCLSCLNVKATENDTTAISLLILYYTEGIGTSKSGEIAAYWTEQLKEVNAAALPDIPPGTVKPVKDPVKYFAGYAFSFHSPIGITFGGVGSRLGWYGRIKTNMSFQSYGNNMFTGEKPADIPKETFLKAVEMKSNSFAVTGGLVIPLEPFYFSVGVGYWQRDLIYKFEEIDDLGYEREIYSWYKKTDASYKGIAVDLDCIIEIGKLYISAGCNVLNSLNDGNKFNVNVDLNAGVGLFF